MLKGKLSRLLRKAALSVTFAAAAAVGAGTASAAVPSSADTKPRPPAVVSVPGPATVPATVPGADLFPLPGFPVPAPADPGATSTTTAVFNYLATLPNQSSHRLISGQWAGYGAVDGVELQVIEKMTGQRVGLVGADYLDFNGTRISTGTVNASMIRYWNQGALVDIDVHMPNPWTGGGPGDKTMGNFSDVITPGTPAYTAYMASLDKIADGLQQLQDAGVTVLFRPMMEMDGDWFWWGQQRDFPRLWAQTFDYLTAARGLHNLLWVYSASGRAPLAYYPGAQYVDLVGCDAYSYGESGGKAPGYDLLVATGKPFALTEFGLQSSVYTTQENPPHDLHAAIGKIRSNMPAAVYFMAWSNAKGEGNNYWAIDAQWNAASALNDDWVQNSAVPWNPAAVATRPPGSPPKQ